MDISIGETRLMLSYAIRRWCWAAVVSWLPLATSWGQTAAPPPLSPPAPTSQTPSSEKAASQNQSTATQSTATPSAAGQSSDARDAEATVAPEFVRIVRDDGTPQALQTAIATYRGAGPNGEVEVTLVGAIHIAERDYYHQLNERFKTYDALLYEMVTDPEMGIPDPEERGLSPISTIQVGLKEMLELTFQLDEIDYRAKNFVHADMTPQEFFDTMKARQEGVLQMFFRSLGSGIAMQSTGRGGDIEVLSALMSNNRTQGLRRAFAEQMQMMDGQMAALTGEDGKSTLITERNAKALQVLKRELAAGKRKIGIFYGAGHLKDMHASLINDFDLKLVDTQWLTAWKL